MRSILPALLFTICFNLHSQTYNAGQALSLYVDINPDTLLTYPCASNWSSSDETFYFDVNRDLQNDFQIKAHCNIGRTASNYLITVTSLNHSSFIRFGRLDSVYNSYMSWWWVDKVAKPLPYGDSINSLQAKWDSTTLYLTDNSYMTGTSHSVNDWESTNDKYVGLKYQNANDTLYGWIRVQCPNSGGCYIKDYSFGGMATSSIKEFDSGNVSIYPTPAIDKIYIERVKSDEMEVSVCDIADKQISQGIKSSSTRTEIDVSSLPNGIYLLRIKTAEGLTVRKIIVRR